MASLGTLTLDLVAKIGGFTGAMDKAARSSQKTARQIARDQERTRAQFKKTMSAVKQVALGIAAGFSVSKITSGIKSLTSAGSDLSETINKGAVVLGDSFKLVDEFSNNAAKSLGQTKKEAIDAASTFGIFGKSAGLSGKELANFSIKFTKLASDFASFHNTSPQDAIVAIGAALRGESEPIRRYGILLDDASLRQAALEKGIVSTTKNALTPQQKVLAASELIWRQSVDAQGDFARTSDGLANKQRILNAEIENSKAVIGQELLPVMSDLYDVFLKLATNEKIIQFFRDTAKGWSFLLGGKDENERKLNQLEEIGGKIRFLAEEQKNLNNIIIRQQQLQAMDSPLFDADKLENTRMLYAAIGEEIKALAGKSAEIGGGGDKAGTGTGRKAGTVGISNEQKKNLESYYKGWQEYDFEATKNIYENKQKLLIDQMAVIDESLAYIKDAANEEMRIDQEIADNKKMLLDEEKRMRMEAVAVAAYSFDRMASLARDYGNDQTALYKSLFIASKTFSIAEASLNMWQAISEAGTLPFPANLGAMAIVGAEMANIISNIMAIGMAHDGISSVPETGTWLLKKGERVTTAETSQKLDNTLNRINSNSSMSTGSINSGSISKEIHLHNHYDGPVFLNRSHIKDTTRMFMDEIEKETTRRGAVA